MTTTPDDYESSDATGSSTGFPPDTSAGKHYMVAVPDYNTSGSALGSYFRHGVPHSGASSYDEVNHRWAAPSSTTTTTQLGDDLLVGIVPPADFRASDGGVRDHTDGNRIVTTRNDVIEVIGGQYRRQVLNNQAPGPEGDPDWEQAPAGLAEEDTSVIEHTYPDFDYDVVATWYLPGTTYEIPRVDAQGHPIKDSQGKPVTDSYTSPRIGEPRIKIDDLRAGHTPTPPTPSTAPERVVGPKPSDSFKRDIYGYTYGFNVYEVLVGQESVVEKTYGRTIHGVSSGIYDEKPDWEHQIDDDLHGNNRTFTVDTQNAADHFDVAELILANRLLEVSRAKDYFEERLLCDEGDFLIVLGANRAHGTFTDKTWAFNVVLDEEATHNIKATAKAGHDIDEHVHAGNNITETVSAGGAIREITQAAGIFGFTGAKGTITEISATPFLFDMTLALSILEIAVSAINITFEVGKKFEFENFKLTHTVEQHEMTELRTQLNTWALRMENMTLGVHQQNLSMAEQVYLAAGMNVFI